MTEVQAIRTFFGLRPGETLTQFMDELRSLAPEEKHALAEQAAEALDVVLEKAA